MIMDEKIEMLESLLELYQYSVCEGEVEQFNIWIKRVTVSLESAGMYEELELWRKAINDSHYSDSHYSVDPTLILQTESMRTVLLGILNKVKEEEPMIELFPLEILEGTKPYVQKIAKQVNLCYTKGLYDASAVMIRRLIEQLIIDCYENREEGSKIENSDGKYVGLDKLVDSFLKESWHKPPHLKKYLPKLKDIKELGDSAAHGRTITTKRNIEKYSKAIEYTFQGLVHLANYS